MMRRPPNTLLFVLLLTLGCQSSPEVTHPEPIPQVEPVSEEPAPQPNEPIRHPALDALAWTQTSVERDICTTQAYATAKRLLDRALLNKTWTAMPDQQSGRALVRQPPAVILDIDETVLDNSPYQARLLRDGEPFRTASWEAWCREASAEPIAGAVEFAKYAASKRVRVFYVTNRTKPLEEATRANLKQHGFPLEPDIDTVLVRGENPEWADADKRLRRAFIAQNYRILLIVGDDLGDFVSGHKNTPEARRNLTTQYAERWGTRWIMIPNPLYGSWEGTLYTHDYKKTASEKRELKAKSLHYGEAPNPPQEGP